MKLKASYETEAYLSAGGYYGIKQTGWDGEEHIVLFTPEQLRHLVIDMTEALSDDSWFSIEEE